MFINNKLKAYFLGWMYSDGCVFYNKTAQSYSTKLKIKEEDKDILILFKNLTNFSIKNEIKDGKKYPYIISYNRQFCQNLIKAGVLPDKSFSNKDYLFFPNIKKEFYQYFIRGLFDGDGSYGIYNGHFNISLFMCNTEFLKQLKNILIGLNINSIITFRPDRDQYSLRIRNVNDCKKFTEYVFKDNLNLSLKRKLDIIKKGDFIYNRIVNKNPRSNEIKIKVETSDGKLLGIFKNTKEIERNSENNNFILNHFSTKGKKQILRASNISSACRTGNPYKGLYYEYIKSKAPLKQGELTGKP